VSAAKGSNAAFLAYLADDGRLFGTGNQPPLYGKAAAAKAFQTSSNGDPKTNVLSWVPENVEVSKDGTLGFSDGRWTFTAPKTKASGHYVTVWRKVGSDWKVVADMGTTDPQKK
jgi:ketosteroid isomerase-like protein